jgi:hypothetical protein
LVRGQSINTSIEVNPWDTVDYGGQIDTIQSFRIDSIANLPQGLCWTTNRANNTFVVGASGCIRISGVTYCQPGQYHLVIIGTLDIGMPIQTNLETFYRKTVIRLIATSASICQPVDTSSSCPDILLYNGTYGNAGVSGKMYFDVNQNHVYDAGEQPVRSQLLGLGNTFMGITNHRGEYVAYPPPGNYVVKPSLSGNMTLFAFYPDSLIVNANSAGVNYDGNDFAVIPAPGYCEGRLSIIAYGLPARPGFNNTLALKFDNIYSAGPVSQTVRFYYSHDHVFVSSTVPTTAVDTINRFIEWSLSNIASSSSWQTMLTFYTLPSVPLSSVLYLSASVSNSTCSGLDTVRTQQDLRVAGSYDPNDKTVSPVGAGPGGRVSPTTDLTYTIRFQNTGTYPAELVRIKDTISDLLDMSTLKVLAASHDYTVSFKDREVTFLFDNIQLPDSNSNEPLSHGYIQYSISPLNTFVQNSVIQNTADIYFDFNAPVRTNTTKNTADNFLGIKTTHGVGEPMVIYPNPSTEDGWHVRCSEKLIGKRFTLLDVSGRSVLSGTVIDTDFEVVNIGLKSGIYFFRLGEEATRLVKF